MKKKRNFTISGKCYRPFEIAGVRGCLVCAHYTGARELIQCKRWIKELQEGTCKFNENRHACRRFELMEELKNKNMTILEKVYARRFTASYLREVIKKYYNDPNAKFNYDNISAEKLAKIIVWYQKNRGSNSRKLPVS